MELYFEINTLSVITTGILAHLLGILWYSNFAFGKIVAKIHKSNHASIQSVEGDPITLPKNLNKIFLGLFWIIAAYIIAYFVQLYGATAITSAAKLGFMLWLLVFGANITSVYFENKNFTTFLIRTSYYLVAIISMAILLSFWHFR